MDLSEYLIMCQAQDTHWWYRGMALIARGILDRYFHRDQGIRILDAGCGTGAGMGILRSYGEVTGVDISEQALRICKKQRKGPLGVASVMHLPFKGDSFDLVASFDVLYYQGVDDEGALAEFKRVLVPGGMLFVRVPAFDWVRGTHDLKVSTRHRYTHKELSGKFKKSGLAVRFMTYANCFLFLPILFKRWMERWTPHQEVSDLGLRFGPLERVFFDCLALESRLIKQRPLPFGLSLMGIAQNAAN